MYAKVMLCKGKTGISGGSEAKFNVIIRYFAYDLPASKIAALSDVSRPPINQLLMKLRIKIALACESSSLLSGEVEVDESYFGACRVRGKKERGAAGKTIIFGILECHGKVYTEIVPMINTHSAERRFTLKLSRPYLIPLKRFADVVQDDLDQWVYAFKNNEVMDEFTAPGIGALKEKLDYLKMDDKERRRFDKHIDYVRSEWGMIEHARWEARQEIENARQEGREKGRDEGRRIFVKPLHDNEISTEIIAASLRLSEPAIRRLLDDG